MKGSLFVYSRLERLDYRLIYAPSKEMLAEPIRNEFIDFAREVINVDNVLNGDIETLRWSIIKRENIVMVGIGCANSQLGTSNKDFAGRNVRGFFGVVINTPNQNPITALCDVRFYQNLYDLFITPLWNTTDQRKANSICAETNIGEMESIDFKSIDVNIDNSKIKVFPQNISFKDILFSAFRHNSVDFVCNLNNLQHITSAELYNFHNAIIIGNDNTTLHQIDVDNGGGDVDDPGGVGEFEYDNLANKIISHIKKYGLKIELFLKILAKKCGCRVIKEHENHYNHPPKHPHSTNRNAVLTNNIEKPESIATISYLETDEEKNARKNKLKNLKEQYKQDKKEQCKQDKDNNCDDQLLSTTLEDIPEIDNNGINNNIENNDLEEL